MTRASQGPFEGNSDEHTTAVVADEDSELPQARASVPSGVEQAVLLVIDDDTDLLNCVRRLLIEEGWVVLTASDPLEALQVYEAHNQTINVVLLDYFLPNLRGDEVFERLQRINPQVRVLLTTACEDVVSSKMLQGGLYGFIQKPLSPRELIGLIRKSLDPQEPPSPPHAVDAAQIDQDS